MATISQFALLSEGTSSTKTYPRVGHHWLTPLPEMQAHPVRHSEGERPGGSAKLNAG